jgi:hypothetical protein
MKVVAAKPEQELEASAAVLALVRDAATQLGASDELADEAARTGVLELRSRSVSVVPAPDEDHLVLCTPLDEEWAAQPVRRQQALRASLPLLLQTGVAFCITPAGPALMCRWSLERADAGLLAAWIREFALMADLIDAGTAAITE